MCIDIGRLQHDSLMIGKLAGYVDCSSRAIFRLICRLIDLWTLNAGICILQLLLKGVETPKISFLCISDHICSWQRIFLGITHCNGIFKIIFQWDVINLVPSWFHPMTCAFFLQGGRPGLPKIPSELFAWEMKFLGRSLDRHQLYFNGTAIAVNRTGHLQKPLHIKATNSRRTHFIIDTKLESTANPLNGRLCKAANSNSTHHNNADNRPKLEQS